MNEIENHFPMNLIPKDTPLNAKGVPTCCAFADTMDKPCWGCNPKCNSWLDTDEKRKAFEETRRAKTAPSFMGESAH